MKWALFFVLILLLSQSTRAEQVKTIFNPFTNKSDYITRVDTATIMYASSYRTIDATNCLWDMKVDTAGALVIALVSCPVSGGECRTGQSLGLLLSITCR